jgi:hypothetical protein
MFLVSFDEVVGVYLFEDGKNESFLRIGLYVREPSLLNIVSSMVD